MDRAKNKKPITSRLGRPDTCDCAEWISTPPGSLCSWISLARKNTAKALKCIREVARDENASLLTLNQARIHAGAVLSIAFRDLKTCPYWQEIPRGKHTYYRALSVWNVIGFTPSEKKTEGDN